MANVVRDPRQYPGAIIPNLATNKVSPKFTMNQVAFVYGSIWKQRYFIKIGDDYFPEPAQWDISNKKWLKYFVPNGGDWWAPFYPPDNMMRPTGPTCDGCHSVDYNIQTKQVAEWNVGCERCHGPGSAHVEQATRGNILNPARMDYVSASDTCIQCHSQGRPLTNPIEGKYYDWPVGYHVGLNLAGLLAARRPQAGRIELYAFSRGHRAQKPDAGERLRAERDVPSRGDLLRLPRCARHEELRAAAETGQRNLPRLPRTRLQERPARGNSRRTHASQRWLDGQCLRGLPYAKNRGGNSRRFRARSHVCFYRTGHDGQIQDSESMHVLPYGQNYRVGHRCDAPLARSVSLAWIRKILACPSRLIQVKGIG